MSGDVGRDALHADAARMLERWDPPDAQQAAWRRDFLDRLATRGPGATRRDGTPSHLTASALVLDPSGTSALLVAHRRAGMWVQPGGHLEDGDATLAAGALREASEESGLPPAALRPALGGQPFDLSRHAFAFGACTEHLDVAFLLVADPGAPTAVSEESDDVAWWPLGALPPGIVPDLPPRLRAAAALLALHP